MLYSKIVQKFNYLSNLWGFVDVIKYMNNSFNKNYKDEYFQKMAAENARVEDIRSYGIEVNKKEGLFLLKDSKNGINIFSRRFSSDLNVFKQIIIDDEFNELFSLIRSQNIDVKNVVDAGGNIGISAIKFSREFAGCNVYSIEPDEDNFNMLRKNVEINKVSVISIQKGIWNKTKRLYFDRTFRDQMEWSITLTEKPTNGSYVDAVSINDLMTEYKFEEIDLLKIDIEGGERYVFDDESDLEFLAKTKVIAIEIHDEFDVSEKILKILENAGFNLSNSGEYVIGIKAKNNLMAKP